MIGNTIEFSNYSGGGNITLEHKWGKVMGEFITKTGGTAYLVRVDDYSRTIVTVRPQHITEIDEPEDKIIEIKD